jgi:hypothetical protein
MKRVYLEREGRQFGLAMRVVIREQRGLTQSLEDPILYDEESSVFSCPVRKAQAWAVDHGYGLLKTGGD